MPFGLPKYQHKYKIVTIDGKCLILVEHDRRKYPKSMNIFLRSRELQELKEKLIKLTEEIKTGKKESEPMKIRKIKTWLK